MSSNEAKGKPKTSAPPPPTALERKWLTPAILGLFIVSTIYFLEGGNAEIVPQDVIFKNVSTDDLVSTNNMRPDPKPDPTSKIRGYSPKRSSKGKVRSDAHPATFENMLAAFEAQRKELYKQLEKDYGPETFKKLLLDFGRTGISPPRDSKNKESTGRMRRKMMLKILEGQAATKNQRSRNLQAGDWSNITFQESRRMKDADLAGFPTYVWATGGHSATAGHGNMWRESYTAVLERAVKDIFATVGLHFIGRNYAMGGTSSAPEIAMCVKEVFGTDIDVLSWDTGMTDGRNYAGMSQYFLRAAILPNRPALVALHLGGHKVRRDVMKELEEIGLTSLVLDDREEKAMNEVIPDTMGLSDEDVAEMPEFVRSFKCGKQLEKGDPGCRQEKFNETICGSRKFKTSWHPGWKAHAMTGNLIALSLSFAVEDALHELVAEKSDPALPDKLRADEEADFKLFMSSDLPKTSAQLSLPEDIDRELVLRGPNFCHTARLPAEIRHLGILTESSLVGEGSYDKGMNINTAMRSEGDGLMPLVFEPGERQNCPIPLNKDYKDAFFVHSRNGWSQLTLPNAAEMKAYGTGAPFRGIISICFTDCNWGKCPKGNLIGEDIELGTGEMEVNGIKVSNFTNYNKCRFLKNAEGHIFKPNSDGRFTIRAKANEENSYIRFSTFVIW